ncbi:MAG: hypothetical protein LBC02_04125 [Planctomycetaceae bacterium]|jgi:tetratricopeptide (TPR) repeat protein|nr:hypothetical protein [Planctomycetaceae bacterium]
MKNLYLNDLSILLLFALTVSILFSCTSCVWQNKNWRVYSANYDAAMKRGDGHDAIRWAKLLKKYSDAGFHSESLGLAYELAGDYELAREQYRIFEQLNDDYNPKSISGFHIGRTLYKQKLFREAFIAYCHAIMNDLTKQFLAKIRRDHILCVYDIKLSKMAIHEFYPFANYMEFMNFIELEYHKLNEDSKKYYGEAVDIFRQTKNELSQEELVKEIMELKGY